MDPILSTIFRVSINPSTTFLEYSLAAIKEAWAPITPSLNYDQYKKEEGWLLEQRATNRFSNFPNIGGNPATRLKIRAPESDEEVFLEANWVADDKIATGYPSVGKMANTYWYCLERLNETRSVIIVNLMASKDVNASYGMFLPTKEGCIVGEKGLLTDKPHGKWMRKVSLVKESCYGDWSHLEIDVGDSKISGYYFPTWKDHADAETEIVAAMIKAIFIEMQGKPNPIIVVNCRAGVGRTGTLLTSLHFYQMIQGGEKDPSKYTLEAIVTVINEFREKRGEAQFVQTASQFVMLCRLIQKFYNQKFS